MPKLKEVIDELKWISDRISTQVRTIGMGILAVTWGLLITQPQIAGPLPDNLKKNLLIIGVIALSSIFCDFLQYFFAYLNNEGLRNRIEEGNLDALDYDYSATSYKLRKFFFWTKQVLLITACAWLLAIIIPFCVKVVVIGGHRRII